MVEVQIHRILTTEVRIMCINQLDGISITRGMIRNLEGIIHSVTMFSTAH